MNEELRKLSGVILKFSNYISHVFNEFANALPKIELPKFNLPNINFKRIKSITEDNSKYGWKIKKYTYYCTTTCVI
jgi:hypothetical protein